MEIEGKIILIDKPESIKNGEFTKQNVVIETEDSYPKKICLVSWNNRITIENFKVGDKVSAKIDIQSREYNGRWYTDVKVWELNSLVTSNGEAAGFGTEQGQSVAMPENEKDSFTTDDPIPF